MPLRRPSRTSPCVIPTVGAGTLLLLAKWQYFQPIVVCVRETNSELRLLREGLRESSCPACSCAQGVVLSATSAGTYPHFSDGRPHRTPGDEGAPVPMWTAGASVQCCALMVRHSEY